LKPWVPRRHPISQTQREVVEYNKKLAFWDWGQILKNDLQLHSSDLYRSSVTSFFRNNNVTSASSYLKYGATVDSKKWVLPRFGIKLYSYNTAKNMEYFKDIVLFNFIKKNNLTRNDLIFHYNLYDKIGKSSFNKMNNNEQLIGLNPINNYTQPMENWSLHQFRPSYPLRHGWTIRFKLPKEYKNPKYNIFGQMIHKVPYVPRIRKNKRDRLVLTSIRQEAPDNYYFKRALTRFYSMKRTREDSNLYAYQSHLFFRVSHDLK
jgi:hypothetical protein